MGSLNSWDVTDANNNAAPPDGWPENTMQYSEVNNTGRAVQGTVRRFFGDVNGSLNGGGVANAYTLTLNEAYAAYFDGMYFACSIPATNTGAVTLDVNGIGVQSVLNRDGSALIGSELDNGGIYEFRYDGTNFQLMGTIGSAIGTTQATLTNSNQPDLVDTDVALRVGAADPDTAQHIEIGPQDIQSKSDATTAASLRLNFAGGFVGLYASGFLRFDTQAAGAVAIKSDDNSDGSNRLLDFEFQDGTLRARIGHEGFDDFVIQNHTDSGWVQLHGHNSVGTLRVLVSGDPDLGTSLYHAATNQVALNTIAGGVQVRSDGNLDTEDRLIQFISQAGTLRAEMGHSISTAGGILEIVNRIHGENVQIRAETLAGTELRLVDIDPDDQGGGTGLGWGRFVVWDDIPAFPYLLVGEAGASQGRDTSVMVRDIQGVERPVGFVLSNPSVFAANHTITDADFMQRTLYHDEGITRVFDLPDIVLADLSYGCMMGIVNLGTGGVQLRPATGVDVEWWDGSAYQTLTGNGSNVVTCPTGRFSLWRINNALYELVGPGIT